MTKYILPLLSIIMVLFLLAACGEVQTVETPTEAPTATPTKAPTATPKPTEKPTPEPTVNVESVNLDEPVLTLGIEDTKQLNAEVLPSSSTDSSIIWTSSNESSVSVSADGLVTGVALGNSTITATSNDSKVSSSCEITVRYPSEGSFQPDDLPSKVIEGTSIDLELMEGAVSQSITSSDDSVLKPCGNILNFVSSGRSKLEITYTLEDGKTKTIKKKITIKAKKQDTDEQKTEDKSDNANPPKESNSGGSNTSEDDPRNDIGGRRLPDKLWGISPYHWVCIDGKWLDKIRGKVYDSNGNFLYNVEDDPCVQPPAEPTPPSEPAPAPEPTPDPFAPVEPEPDPDMFAE